MGVKVKEDLTGRKFDHWTVLEELGGSKVRAQCDCENKTIKILYKKALKEGKTKSCGCARGEAARNTKTENGTLSKYIGMEVNGWKVIDTIPNSYMLLCEDAEGNQKEILRRDFADGSVKPPNYSRIVNDLTGKYFGHWKVLEEVGHGKVRVECDCKNKTQRVIYKSSLLLGKSMSCGCASAERAQATMLERYGDLCTLKLDNPRENWQIETVNNKDKFIEFLKKFKEENDRKPTILDISNVLSINKASAQRTIQKFEASDYVKSMTNESYMEREVCSYVEDELCITVQKHCRDILSNNYEVDMYIPDKKIALEFNGDYWHSDLFKSKDYHQGKTLECMSNGIRLIHIFEYEWVNNNDKIKRYLKSVLKDCKNRVYARNCTVEAIENKEAVEFEEKNHLQGGINANISIGIKYDTKIIGVMTFSKSRFDKDYDYEIVRLCYDTDYSIVGGAEKMFKEFIRQYDPKSVVSYCDISKFVGEVYSHMGFEFVEITEPSYVWCNNHNKIITRYQAQKQRLLSSGVITQYECNNCTESDIMNKRGYYKIYNSGNAKYVYYA